MLLQFRPLNRAEKDTRLAREGGNVVSKFRFRKKASQDAAEAYAVKAVLMTAVKPGER
jgi:hypothetical protein